VRGDIINLLNSFKTVEEMRHFPKFLNTFPEKEPLKLLHISEVANCPDMWNS
jgi:hypothetical protein